MQNLKKIGILLKVKKTTNLFKNFTRLDQFLDKQTVLFLLLILVLILRIPNLFEPYWYGDEGIYLTIGQSLNKGAKLYSEIIDHKTPLIYYLARVQTQINFRILNILWMLATTTIFYYFAKKLLKSNKLTLVAGLIFVLLTTLPWLEGNIPNGELFVLGFILFGYLIISKTEYFEKFLEKKPAIKKNYLALYLGGFFIGLGILTKVPAILDLATIFSIAYFSFINLNSLKNWKKYLNNFVHLSKYIAIIILGTVTPIIFSIIYFIVRGSGKDYLDFGLLYNFRYAGNWGLPFDNSFLVNSFTLPGKIIYLIILVLIITGLKKYIKPALQFTLIWFGADLFASLLSNRPYPHYFIQLVPPLSLLLAFSLSYIGQIIRTKKINLNYQKIIPMSLSMTVILVFISIIFLLDFRPYPSFPYYSNWLKLVTGKITKENYRQSFDSLMEDNYKAAPIIKSTGTPDLFIWGTNPMLYALTETQPTGRFTVSFHIKDFDAFSETANDLMKKAPPFIVVMKNEEYVFPELNNFLVNYYSPDNSKFDNFILWKKTNANNY